MTLLSHTACFFFLLSPCLIFYFCSDYTSSKISSLLLSPSHFEQKATYLLSSISCFSPHILVSILRSYLLLTVLSPHVFPSFFPFSLSVSHSSHSFTLLPSYLLLSCFLSSSFPYVSSSFITLTPLSPFSLLSIFLLFHSCLSSCLLSSPLLLFSSLLTSICPSPIIIVTMTLL